MAVREDDYVKKTYYSIHDGKVVRQWFQEEAPEGFSKLQKRITPESKRTVWFKNYLFSGVITDAFEKENTRLDKPVFEFHLVLDDESELIVKSQSGYHKSFLLAMQNIPKGQEITFSPYNFLDREKNKQVIGMVIKDGEGNKIPPFYTKDDPKGLPQPKQNKKKKTWDWTAVEEFLDEKFDAWKADYFQTPENIEVNEPEEVSAPSGDEDDVPF